LSAIPQQTVNVGEIVTLNLMTAGATARDTDAAGLATGDQITFQLDPDIPEDTPVGALITSAGVLTWSPTAAQEGTHVLTIIIMDQGTPVLADAETITVVVMGSQNVAPQVDLNGAQLGLDFASTFTESEGSVPVVAADLSVMDADDTSLASARIAFVSRPDGNLESLTVTTTGTTISGNFNETTGVLNLTGVDTVAHYQQVLRTLRYNHTSDAPTAGDRVVEVVVNDGTSNSSIARSTVTVVPVNDAPNMAPIADQFVSVGEQLELTVAASDADSAAITFQFDPNSNPPASATLTRSTDTTAVFRWTPQTSDGPGPFLFRVIVTDGGPSPQSDVEEFTVTLATETAPMLTVAGSPLPEFDGSPDAAVGRVAPTFSTVNPQGEPVSLTHDGKAKLVGFFAHWCPHCQAELPRVADWLAENSLPNNVEIVVVSSAVDPGRANYPPSAWFDREAWPLNVSVDSVNSGIAEAYGLSAYPFWVVIDGNGHVLARTADELTTAQFADLVALAANS
jgi:thiol-disulfide isomerase/thioredoxin